MHRESVSLRVSGVDGIVLDASSHMEQVSRDPAAQAAARHHQYPDGFVLYLGTMFAPTGDRVTHSEDAPPWRFGIRDLMATLALAADEARLVGDDHELHAVAGVELL